MPIHFEGTFKPPAVHVAKSPIKIAGPGRCHIGKEGLEVSGYQAARGAKRDAALILLLVLGLACALVFAADTLLTAVPPIVLQLAGGAIGGLVYFFIIAGRDKHLADKPVALQIPWASIRGAARDMRHPGGIVIEVAEGDPKGTLHFHPVGGMDEFLAAMRVRGVSAPRARL